MTRTHGLPGPVLGSQLDSGTSGGSSGEMWIVKPPSASGVRSVRKLIVYLPAGLGTSMTSGCE